MIVSGRAAMAAGIESRYHVEDDIQSLRGENLDLKKRLNGQEDVTKKLLTRVQRLTDELKRARDTGTGPGGKVVVTRRDPETDDLIDELRNQVANLNKFNGTLKNKVEYWKTMSETQSRKRGPYDHVASRIDSGTTPQRRMVPAMSYRNGKVVSRPTKGKTIANSAEALEEIEQLQEVIGMLRTKLSQTEQDLAYAREEANRYKTEKESTNLQDDIDRIALQRELADTKKKLTESSERVVTLEERIRGLMEFHQEAVKAVEDLNAQLKDEKRKTAEMESQVRQLDALKKTEKELRKIIDDLRADKKSLEGELSKLVQIALQPRRGLEDDDERDEEIKSLRREVDELKRQREELQQRLRNVPVSTDTNSSQEFIEERERLQHDYEALASKHESLMNKYSLLEKLTQVELERLITLIQSRDIDSILANISELEAAKSALESLRIEVADVMQELSKTRKMFELQVEINKEYKGEVDDLTKKLNDIKAEYEAKLNELETSIKSKVETIASLESQLQSRPAQATQPRKQKSQKRRSSAVSITHGESNNQIHLDPGQNLLDITITSATLNESVVQSLKSMKDLPEIVNFDSLSQMMSFIMFDFYDFDSVVTNFGVGLKPTYNSMARLKIGPDDKLMSYLKKESCSLDLCFSNGTEWTKVAKCEMKFREVYELRQVEKLEYKADLISVDGNQRVIGQVSFWMRLKMPINEQLKLLKEKKTQNASKQSLKAQAGPIPHEKLDVLIDKCRVLRPSHTPPSLYAAFKFHDSPEIVTDTISGTLAPMFQHRSAISCETYTESDLNDYLQNGILDIYVLDERDRSGNSYVGVAKLSLKALKDGDGLEGEYELMGPDDQPNGSIKLSFQWGKESSNDKAKKQRRRTRQSKSDVTTAPEPNPLVPTDSELSVPSELLASRQGSMEEMKPANEVASLEKKDKIKKKTKKAPKQESVTKSSELNLDPTPPVDEKLNVTIDAVRFNFGEPEVDNLFASTTQFFISFDFLDFPPEDLESPTIVLTKTYEATLNVGFETEFDFDPYLQTHPRLLLHRALTSHNPTDSEIVFTVVSEPRDSDGECVDLASAKVNLRDLAVLGEKREEWVRKECPLRDLKGEFVVGTCWITIKGSSLLKELQDGNL